MATAYKTNYYDPSGQAKTGYIIDGKTYKDAEGTTRVDLGSVVETANGNYVLTSSGGVKTDSIQRSNNNLANQIRTLKEQSRLQNEALYKSKKAELESQKNKLNEAYLREARNEYLSSMESKKNINQLLKAQGIHGGMSESAILSNQLAHDSAVNTLKAIRDDNLSDLDMQLLNLRNETDYNIASQNMEYDKLYLEYADNNLDRMLKELQAEKSLSASNYFERLNLAQDQAQFEAELAEEIRNNDLEYNRYMAALEQDKYLAEKELEQDRYFTEKELAQDAANALRNYNLSVSKANQSYAKYASDAAYEKAEDDAKIRAEFGDFSGYQALYGWSDAKREAAELNWRIEHKR